jgi:pimeloyl-ACP methyl ester carboxylesterase
MPYFKTEISNYYLQQKGQGQTLIFAHGLFVDHTIFSHQFEHLCNSYNCLSFDMPGHGKSTFRENGWTLDEIVDDFYEFIKINKINNPILIGQSQGGMIFMRLAIKFPDLVGGLVLIGTSSKAEYKARFPFWREVIQVLNSKNKTNINSLLERIQKNVVSENFLKNSASKATQELKMMQSHHTIGLKLSTEAAVLNRTDVSTKIHKIKCKTLIVCGKNDHATPLDISEMMKSEIKDAQLEIIDNASHHIPIETPQVLTDSISKFILNI